MLSLLMQQHFELVKYSTIRKLKATQKCNEGVNRGTELKRGRRRKRSEHGLCSRLCKIPQLQILLCEKEELFSVYKSLKNVSFKFFNFVPIKLTFLVTLLDLFFAFLMISF